MAANSSGKCLICSTPNAAVHLGIDACRACASFFKRAQLSGHRYLCRRGDHKCETIRAAGSMCRGCRLDKCNAIGMVYDGPMRKAYIERRRVVEFELELYFANFDFAVATFNVTLIESWLFFRRSFPSVDDFSFTDQRELFRMCMPHFSQVDCFYRTKRIWGDFTGFSMCSVLGCHSLQQPEMWMGHQKNGPMRDELLETISGYMDDQLAMVVPSFEKANICEREMHALLALLLCEAEPQDEFIERFEPFLKQIRFEILHDLRRFYTEEMGLKDYSTRLGTLITLCHTFREANTMFQEFFRMQVTVFDLYAKESLLNDILI